MPGLTSGMALTKMCFLMPQSPKLLYLWKYYFMVDSQPGMFAETQMVNRSDPVRRSAHLRSVGREQGVDGPG